MIVLNTHLCAHRTLPELKLLPQSILSHPLVAGETTSVVARLDDKNSWTDYMMNVMGLTNHENSGTIKV